MRFLIGRRERVLPYERRGLFLDVLLRRAVREYPLLLRPYAMFARFIWIHCHKRGGVDTRINTRTVSCVLGYNITLPRTPRTHMSLHVNARYVLLTYAQCGDLDGFTVMARISSLGGECIVGREHHADGGLHLHVFCDFGRKFRSRKIDVFDVDGHHPNVQPSKGTPRKGYDYAIKDGDVICGGLLADDIVERAAGTGKTRDIWTQITSAPNRELFWELCLELDPKSAATAFTQLSKFADWQYRVEEPEYSHPGGFEFIRGDIDGRDDWLQQSGVGPQITTHVVGK